MRRARPKGEMMKYFVLLLIACPLSAMEEIVIDNHPTGGAQEQAESILKMCLNGSGAPLKPLVIPKLTEKINELHESQPHKNQELSNELAIRSAVIGTEPLKRLSNAELAGLAENLLATAIHEVIGDKEKLAATEAQKKKWSMVAAGLGILGTVASTIGAILSSELGQQGAQACAQCICNTTGL